MFFVKATDWLMMSFTKMGQLGSEQLGEWLRRVIKITSYPEATNVLFPYKRI